ncbi:hypothetical protein ACQ858_22225 [Variovorax ureilyticus]|uniref:hypothetical protein n=1 Tax=Variovorax ureilyticus TaxID=1836198 RepID=UPI003D6665C6
MTQKLKFKQDMHHPNPELRWARHAMVAILLVAGLGGCSAVKKDKEGRVYHCMDLKRAAAPPNTRAKPYPLERFEYGTYVDVDRPTIASAGVCTYMQLPRSAYLRYRVDGKVVEKTLDLSTLTPERVANNTLEFYVDEDGVEVRLLSPKLTRSQGDLEPKREVIVRQ